MAEQGAEARGRISRLTRFLTRDKDGSRSRRVREPPSEGSAGPGTKYDVLNEVSLNNHDAPSPHTAPINHTQSRNEHGVRQRVPQFPSQLRQGKLCNIDIVAVHGLGGHALDTWKGKNKKNWLIDEEFLPTALPEARIFTFGYNANNFVNEVASKVMDHANALLAGLLTHRVGCEQRPIIFIAHSLGGIVVKEALTSNRPEYKGIVQSTSGIAFLGTPHHGSGLADYLNLAKKLAAWARMEGHPRSQLHIELEPFSDTIRSVNDRFTSPAHRYIMRSFAEQKPIRLPPPLGSQLIVPQGSAMLGHPNELPVPVYADHSTICKFESPEDDVYFSIRQQLVFLKDMSLKRIAEVDVESDELVDRFNALKVPTEAFSTRHCKYYEVPYVNHGEVFGTQEIIDKIKANYEEGVDNSCDTPKCVVLYGMGGVGKSTIAHTYARVFRHTYEGVFWTSAREAGGVTGLDALKYDFLKWARRIGCPLGQWAGDDQRKWLLVVDNFDDLSGITEQQFHNMLPQGGRGHVIVTSRRLRATMFGDHSIRVEPLPVLEGTSMLLSLSFNRTKTLRDETVAGQIVAKLGGLPLAIRQCAAYANKLQLRLIDYPHRIQLLLEQIDRQLPNIESQRGLHDDGEADYENLFAVVEMSFQQLFNTSPLAADVLTLMAYLDASNISEAILHRGFQCVDGWSKLGTWTHSSLATLRCKSLNELLKSSQPGKELSQVLGTLVDFSLIQRIGLCNNFGIHPVTQYWLKQRSRAQSEEIFSDALSIIEHGFPEPERLKYYMILDNCSHPYLWDYKPHARALLTSLATMRKPVPFGGDIKAMRLAIKAYNVYVASVQGDEGVWLNKSLMDAVFRRSDVPMNLWFEAVATMSTEIHQEFNFPRDMFQNLPELTFAGKTWAEQRKHLQYPSLDSSQGAGGANAAANSTQHQDFSVADQTEASNLAVQDHIPWTQTRETVEMREVLTTIRKEKDIEIHELNSLPSMFPPIDPVLTSNGGVISSISVHILRLVCELAFLWRSNRNKITVTDDGVIIDSRDGSDQLGFVLSRYVHAKELSTFSERENYHIGRALYLMSGTQYASENPDRKREWLQGSVNMYIKSVSLTTQFAVQAVQDLVLMDVALGDTAAVEAHYSRFTTNGINQYNFTLIKFLALYHADVLNLTHRPLRRIEVLENQLKTFQQVPSHLRQYWEFYNDPILDMYEELIFCYAASQDKHVEHTRTLHSYVQYTQTMYPPPPYPDPVGLFTYTNFLGFGLGSNMQDSPYGRQRIYIEDNGSEVTSTVLVLDNSERITELVTSTDGDPISRT